MPSLVKSITYQNYRDHSGRVGVTGKNAQQLVAEEQRGENAPVWMTTAPGASGVIFFDSYPRIRTELRNFHETLGPTIDL